MGAILSWLLKNIQNFVKYAMDVNVCKLHD